MIFKKDIVCIKTLGKGPFFRDFVVCLTTNIPKQHFMKLRSMSKRQIIKNKLDEKMVIHELCIRSNLRHPFLVNQICAFQDYDNLFYLSEYAPVSILDKASFLHPFSTSSVRFYAAEILSCLLYLHGKQHVYTFLSPANVLIGQDGHIKLDFAFCNGLNLEPDEMNKYIEYASPIYLMNHDFSFASDFWSLGIVLYQMAAGFTPFGSETTDLTAYAMLSRDLEFPDWFDTDLCSLIDILLTPNLFSDNLEENSELLKSHAFFAGINWEMLENRRMEPPYVPEIPSVNMQNKPFLGALYTSDFIVGEKDGYGNIFTSYNTSTLNRK